MQNTFVIITGMLACYIPVNNANKEFDVAIIGGGPSGLATAYHIAKSKPYLRVVILEQYDFLNDKGSSPGPTRQFRLQYSEKYMAELANSSLKYWHELRSHSSSDLLEHCGSLWYGGSNPSSAEGDLKQAMDVMNKLGILYEKLNASQIQSRFSFQAVNISEFGFLQMQGGTVNLKLTQQTLYNYLARMPNTKLMSYSKVTGIRQLPKKGFVITFNENVQIVSQKLVVTAGPFINEVIKNLGLWIDINIWELTNAYYRIKKPDKVVNVTWYYFKNEGKNRDFYGFPDVHWAYTGYQRVGPAFPDRIISNPYNRSGIPSRQTLGIMNAWVKMHMPGLHNVPEFTSTCLASFSADPKKPFLLDFGPEPFNKDMVVYTSGWTAKFIPLLGKIIADLVLNGTTEYDISNFKIDWPKIQNDTSSYFKSNKQDGLKLDVAVIGGGASGLYAGYRLLTGQNVNGNKTNLKVNIFEQSFRIGGRVHSLKLSKTKSAGELGAMRYMPEQKIISGLIEIVFAKQFGLKQKEFSMGNPDHNLYYLRQHRFFTSNFEKAKITNRTVRTGYKIKKKFRNKSPDEVMTQITEEVLQAAGLPLDQIRKSKNPRTMWLKAVKKLKYLFSGPYRGLPLHEMGFQNLIYDQSSQETLKFLLEASGYHSNFINRNAAMALYSFVSEFFKGQAYKTIEGGMEKLLVSMASAFVQAGGDIWIQNELVTFEKNRNSSSKYRYVLTVRNVVSNSEWTVYAKNIILAMPKRSLELINTGQIMSKLNPDKGQQLAHNLNSILVEPAVKLLMAFSHPWWKNQLGTTAGFSITDLPLSKCFYFTDSKTNESLLLATYNDMDTVLFWEALEKHPGEKNFSHSSGASSMIVKEAMRQLRQLHGPRIKIPNPYATAYVDWGHDPFGAGYHDWKAKVRVWDVMPLIRQPDPQEAIHIIGEAYSEQQGWIEGAFCVSEKLMEDCYGLQRPSWLDADYDLGW